MISRCSEMFLEFQNVMEKSEICVSFCWPLGQKIYSSFKHHWYCWWLKSCTTWDVENPVNNRINYLSTGAGFQPSTVWNTLVCSAVWWFDGLMKVNLLPWMDLGHVARNTLPELHPGRLTWNLQITINLPFRKEHDLPNLHDDVPAVNLQGCNAIGPNPPTPAVKPWLMNWWGSTTKISNKNHLFIWAHHHHHHHHHHPPYTWIVGSFRNDSFPIFVKYHHMILWGLKCSWL